MLSLRTTFRTLFVFIMLMLLISSGVAKTPTATTSNVTNVFYDNELQDDDNSLSQRNNLITLDLFLTWGGYIGLNYERSLVDFISLGVGVAPTYFKHFGVLIPVGANLFLPLGKKHSVGGITKLFFYAGGELSSEEIEGIDVIANIAWRNYSYSNTITPTPLFGIFYQFKSEKFWIFRFSIGVINQLHDKDAPFIELKTGYNF